MLTDAYAYTQAHPGVGCFGVYTHDYNRARSFDVHRQRITREMRWQRRLLGRTPSYAPVLRRTRCSSPFDAVRSRGLA